MERGPCVLTVTVAIVGTVTEGASSACVTENLGGVGTLLGKMEVIRLDEELVLKTSST